MYNVGKRHSEVLIAEEDYRAMLETMDIMSVPGLKESIVDMQKRPLDEHSEEIDL